MTTPQLEDFAQAAFRAASSEHARSGEEPTPTDWHFALSEAWFRAAQCGLHEYLCTHPWDVAMLDANRALRPSQADDTFVWQGWVAKLDASLPAHSQVMRRSWCPGPPKVWGCACHLWRCGTELRRVPAPPPMPHGGVARFDNGFWFVTRDEPTFLPSCSNYILPPIVHVAAP